MTVESEEDAPAVLLFSGHRIDGPDRSPPRFPARIEDAIREEIHKLVDAEWRRHGEGGLCAISSAANGGDILFLECCAELGIPAKVFLALPQEEFCAASVADGGEDWVRRYRELCRRFPVQVLDADDRSGGNVFQQTNRWMLDSALDHGGENVTLIALWDGADGDGAGGTGDMVTRATAAGARLERINPMDCLRG